VHAGKLHGAIYRSGRLSRPDLEGEYCIEAGLLPCFDIVGTRKWPHDPAALAEPDEDGLCVPDAIAVKAGQRSQMSG
jgi:hypothetical protein